MRERNADDDAAGPSTQDERDSGSTAACSGSGRDRDTAAQPGGTAGTSRGRGLKGEGGPGSESGRGGVWGAAPVAWPAKPWHVR